MNFSYKIPTKLRSTFLHLGGSVNYSILFKLNGLSIQRNVIVTQNYRNQIEDVPLRSSHTFQNLRLNACCSSQEIYTKLEAKLEKNTMLASESLRGFIKIDNSLSKVSISRVKVELIQEFILTHKIPKPSLLDNHPYEAQKSSVVCSQFFKGVPLNAKGLVVFTFDLNTALYQFQCSVMKDYKGGNQIFLQCSRKSENFVLQYNVVVKLFFTKKYYESFKVPVYIYGTFQRQAALGELEENQLLGVFPGRDLSLRETEQKKYKDNEIQISGTSMKQSLLHFTTGRTQSLPCLDFQEAQRI